MEACDCGNSHCRCCGCCLAGWDHCPRCGCEEFEERHASRYDDETGEFIGLKYGANEDRPIYTGRVGPANPDFPEDRQPEYRYDHIH